MQVHHFKVCMTRTVFYNSEMFLSFTVCDLLTNFSMTFFFTHTVDDPALLNRIIESLPAVPPCELVDPADDQTLQRLIEVLEKRHRMRQMMTEQVNKTGTAQFFYTTKNPVDYKEPTS